MVGKRLSLLPTAGGLSHLEVRDLVAFAQCDLEYIHGADESRKPCQTLLAAPTYTNQQSISPWGLQDAIDMAATEEEAEACCFDQTFYSAKHIMVLGGIGTFLGSSTSWAELWEMI